MNAGHARQQAGVTKEEAMRRAQGEPRVESYDYRKWKEQRRAQAKANQWETGHWDVPYQHEAEAVEQAFRLVELCAKSCQRAVRQLANIRLGRAKTAADPVARPLQERRQQLARIFIVFHQPNGLDCALRKALPLQASSIVVPTLIFINQLFPRSSTSGIRGRCRSLSPRRRGDRPRPAPPRCRSPCHLPHPGAPYPCR